MTKVSYFKFVHIIEIIVWAILSFLTGDVEIIVEAKDSFFLRGLAFYQRLRWWCFFTFGGITFPTLAITQRWSPTPTIGGAIQVYLGGTPGLAIEGTVCCTLVILPTVILERKYAWSVLDVCTGRVYFVRQSDLEEEKHSNTFHILRRWMREPLED